MKLVYSPPSPFVRKVTTLIYHAGLDDRIELVNVKTSALSVAEEARAANPLGKIPVMILDDGKAIFDSRVITRFLDDLAGSDLYPQESMYDILTLEALADGIMESAVSITYETKLRPENEQSPSWIEAQWSKVLHAVKALENDAFKSMKGNLNMGQIAVACALGYLDFRHDARQWRNGHPNLASWNEKIMELPALIKTIPTD
ncbi:MAG: glutathione S-transferase [Rhodobacteraceae bacterium]|nr:glutathione S-transferase [Paracoccaceae bacterium]